MLACGGAAVACQLKGVETQWVGLAVLAVMYLLLMSSVRAAEERRTGSVAHGIK